MGEPSTIADLARDIKAIAEPLDGRPANPFSADEIERIKRAAELVEWFDTLGWIGKRIMWLFAAAVLLISQWERIKAFFMGGGQ